jgi:uncharacterized protein YybS (DUF2232 family)
MNSYSKATLQIVLLAVLFGTLVLALATQPRQFTTNSLTDPNEANYRAIAFLWGDQSLKDLFGTSFINYSTGSLLVVFAIITAVIAINAQFRAGNNSEKDEREE